MDELEQLGELARSKVLSPRPAPSPRETHRANRALWAVAFGVVAAAIGLFYVSRVLSPRSGVAAPGTFPAMPTLWQIVWGLTVATGDVFGGLGAVALGLSALHAESGRYSATALVAIVLGSVGWLGLIFLILS